MVASMFPRLGRLCGSQRRPRSNVNRRGRHPCQVVPCRAMDVLPPAQVDDITRPFLRNQGTAMPVRILDVREITKPIASPIRNAYIDFSKMTTSLVAVITDVVREGRPVVGYGFNSNGRYGQGGLIRERFAPRILDADPL